jgi:thiol-disulfide isomerase/thioredoxin
MVRTSVLVLCVVLIGMLGCRQEAKPVAPKQPEISAGEVGWRLPTFSAKDLNGRTINSADLRGKVVLVDFWATWCEPCKREMPGYQRLLDQYGSRGFVVIGFKANMMADTEPPLRFAREVGVHYRLIVADDGLMHKFGGIEGLPTTMIFDRSGILREKVIGFEYTNVIESQIKPLI